MGVVKKVNIENGTFYLYNDMLNIKYFDSIFLKIDKKPYKHIAIYNIGYIAIKKNDNCETIYSVNSLYLLVYHASR